MKTPDTDTVALFYIVLEFLETMRDDLRRRALDETGEQRNETTGRIEQLEKLIAEIRGTKGRDDYDEEHPPRLADFIDEDDNGGAK